MLNELQRYLSEYEIIPITEDNYYDAVDVYESNQDFFLLTEGKKASISGMLENINAIPNGFDIKNKYHVGLQQNGSVVAVIDFLVGYPACDCVWVGLLLVHGEFKGKSMGSCIVKALLSAARDTGCKEAKLGVIDKNTRGVNFWEKNGFVKIAAESMALRGEQLEIIVLKYTLN